MRAGINVLIVDVRRWWLLLVLTVRPFRERIRHALQRLRSVNVQRVSLDEKNINFAPRVS
jgi:hypothetical protein